MAYNILIVDDSAVMRSMLTKCLNMCGLDLGELRQAANGQEGLNTIRDQWVDLVLVDLNMPVMGGEEMVTHLRANPETKKMPVIVVSTESSEVRIERLRALDTYFVHKPFTPESLGGCIEKALGGTNAHA